MKDKKSKSKYDIYKSIRKEMPKPSKVILPKKFRHEVKHWRWDGNTGEDQ